MAYSINKNTCNGCDACRSACPVQAISGEQHFPHEVDSDLCVSCGLCVNFCENFAIRSGSVKSDAVPPDDWHIPGIDIAMCNGCGMCVTVCPMYALRLTEPRYLGDTDTYAELIDPAMCIDCQKCSEHCPVGAITMKRRFPKK